MTEPATGISGRCRQCGTELAPSLLACPMCHALVHADRLKTVARQAEEAEARSDREAALTLWRETLSLLPSRSTQYGQINSRVAALEKQRDGGAAAAEGASKPRAQGLRGWWAAIVAGLLSLLSKGKLLLLGLTKLKTLLSMAAFFGIYWTTFGWPFALGLVLSIYIHEMGHVAALRHYGIPATAPMFIPGLGAFIRLKAMPQTPLQEAVVGLAGPVWGLGAALLAWLAYWLTGNSLFASLAHVGAIINLFNLIPIWQLDGAHALHALNKQQRWLLAAVVAAAYLWSQEPMMLLVGLVLLVRCFMAAPAQGEGRILGEFALLVLALAAVGRVRGLEASPLLSYGYAP